MLTIIGILGLIACIWCILDVWKKSHVNTLIKVLITIGLLVTNWIGLAVYYFIVKDRI